MATKNVTYIDYAEAVDLHLELMELWGETRFGIDFRELLDSALARPRNAAVYENADIIRQAASLCFGLIKNHQWEVGNKLTATLLATLFLKRNGYKVFALTNELVDLCLNVEADRWNSNETESCLKHHFRMME